MPILYPLFRSEILRENCIGRSRVCFFRHYESPSSPIRDLVDKHGFLRLSRTKYIRTESTMRILSIRAFVHAGADGRLDPAPWISCFPNERFGESKRYERTGREEKLDRERTRDRHGSRKDDVAWIEGKAGKRREIVVHRSVADLRTRFLPELDFSARVEKSLLGYGASNAN